MSDLLEQARELAHYFETSRWSVKPERDAAATLRALVARVEAAERDAERWRTARYFARYDRIDGEDWIVFGRLPWPKQTLPHTEDYADAAIDEARKQA